MSKSLRRLLVRFVRLLVLMRNAMREQSRVDLAQFDDEELRVILSRLFHP